MMRIDTFRNENTTRGYSKRETDQSVFDYETDELKVIHLLKHKKEKKRVVYKPNQDTKSKEVLITHYIK